MFNGMCHDLLAISRVISMRRLTSTPWESISQKRNKLDIALCISSTCIWPLCLRLTQELRDEINRYGESAMSNVNCWISYWTNSHKNSLIIFSKVKSLQFFWMESIQANETVANLLFFSRPDAYWYTRQDTNNCKRHSGTVHTSNVAYDISRISSEGNKPRLVTWWFLSIIKYTEEFS